MQSTRQPKANRTLEPAPVKCMDITGTMKVHRDHGEVRVYAKRSSTPIRPVRPRTAQSSYKQNYKDLSHASGGKKPLVPYDVKAHRNTLQPPTYRPPAYRNVSQIQLGNPNMPMSAADTFSTTNRRTFVNIQGLPVGYQNQGIQSRISQWLHRKQ